MIDRKTYSEESGVRIYRYPLPLLPTKSAWGYLWEYPWAMLMTLIYALAVFARDRFDVIHACNPPDLFFILGWLFRPLGVKFVFDQHDLCPETYTSRYGKRGGGLSWILHILERQTYRIADLVIATNESYKKTAVERGGCRPDTVHVVRSAPDLKEFRPEPPDAELKAGRPYLICYLGTMAPQDGVDHLIRSVRHIVHNRSRNDLRVVLIGGGDSIPELQQLVSDYKLDEIVHFTGRVPDSELRRWLSTADVCAAPDPVNPLNNVSTMNKILEYMAMGKPIVSYNLTESRHSAGSAALYARDNDCEDFGDRLLDLLNDAPRRTKMGSIGRTRLLKRLSWRRSEIALIRAYDSIPGKRQMEQALPEAVGAKSSG
jgi:glycosyltransferase involved in cell wall biosynthesis